MALVGAEAARAWGQEGFAAQALALARNASWWNELKRLNVPFDPNSFAHADAVPALVGRKFCRSPVSTTKRGCSRLMSCSEARCPPRRSAA